MIVFPKNWRNFGVPVTLDDIDSAMRRIVRGIDCINLSFSGGVDSSLLLYYLLEVKGRARCFTTANDYNHPDIHYSANAIGWFEKKYSTHIDRVVLIRPKLEGDDLVKAFYSAIKFSFGVKAIIAGDCIDELSCGYYDHQDLREETYQDYLERLQAEHLEPLDSNSGDVRVYLPYADSRVSSLLYRVPSWRKVSETCRKIVMMELADGKVPTDSIERKKYGFATNKEKATV